MLKPKPETSSIRLHLETLLEINLASVLGAVKHQISNVVDLENHVRTRRGGASLVEGGPFGLVRANNQLSILQAEGLVKLVRGLLVVEEEGLGAQANQNATVFLQIVSCNGDS